jgi:hypothetical protein
MSTTYSDLIYTQYPDNIDSYEYMQDMTSDLLDLVSQYESLINSKKFSEAAQLLMNNPSLNRIYFNAEKYNRIVDSVKAIQRLYFSDIQKYIEQLITYRGEYSTTTAYKKYDVVLYNNGSAYLCISDSSIGILPTSDKWVQITLQGEQGIPGIGLNFSGAWTAVTTYQKDSCVTYNNVLYASKIDDNLGKTPSINSEYWFVIFDISQFATYDNSSSGLSSVNLQDAIDELNININNNKTNINNNTNSINTMNTKLNTIEQGAQKNTVTGIKGSSESSYRTGNVDITKANIGLSNVENTKDSDKSVKYATSAGSATNATNANHAQSASNADTVDGFNFQISTNDLTAGSSSLTTNVFYFVYE